MAEAIVPITQEITHLRKNLPRELASLENHLRIISSFLKDAESKAEERDFVKAWVMQVRNLAFRIKNIVDEYIILTQTQPKNPSQSIPHQIARAIAEIEEEMVKLERRKSMYDLREDPGNGDMGKWEDPRAGFLYDGDPEFTGSEQPEREIVELLNLEGLVVVAMMGMGGIGKTTLARKVYDNIQVKRQFYVRAWVSVGQRYGSTEKLFRKMLLEFYESAAMPPHEVADMEELSLIDDLRTFLHDKRYMVVFDDVWDPGLWSNVKNALPDNGKGSKIVLTTRKESVATTWRASSANNHVYRLKLLPPNKAWELFCKKAFQGEYGGKCPSWLEEISHNIVDKCEGLPLALVTIGGLLSTKEKSFVEWRTFRDSLGRELDRHPQLMNISRLLLLSYNDLPYYLKPCLLYFAMFPSGSSIECNRLLKLWTAEDFIKRERGQAIEIEDVAKNCLIELVQRSLVQVSARYDCGRARTFRVHDLIYEVLRSKLEELNFCQVLEKENPEVDMQSRRLSIQGVQLNDASRSIDDKCGIRSILLFGVQEAVATPLSNSLLKSVYLLKVLDLQAAPLEQIPDEVGDLFLLQYLSLRFTKVKSIPKSIGKLQNLLTLDLKRCPVSDLPIEISNLRKLRHFVVYQNTWHNTLKVWVIRAVTIPERALGNLGNLQKLADVNVAKSTGFMDQLTTFKKLKYLAISNVKQENSLTLCKGIEQLNYLESLNITVDYESHDPVDLQHVTTPPLQLQRLYLIGPLKEIPEWIGKLENLNKLRFKGSKLEDIPFDLLQGLPNLTMLGINKDVYYGERLVFQAGGFKKLKAMYFNSLLNVSSVEIQRGALPLLEDLLIHRSPKLKEVPLGLEYLEKLTSLKVVEMPQEFVDSLSSLHHIVKHVADILVGYQTPTGIYIYEKL